MLVKPTVNGLTPDPELYKEPLYVAMVNGVAITISAMQWPGLLHTMEEALQRSKSSPQQITEHCFPHNAAHAQTLGGL